MSVGESKLWRGAITRGTYYLELSIEADRRGDTEAARALHFIAHKCFDRALRRALFEHRGLYARRARENRAQDATTS